MHELYQSSSLYLNYLSSMRLQALYAASVHEQGYELSHRFFVDSIGRSRAISPNGMIYGYELKEIAGHVGNMGVATVYGWKLETIRKYPPIMVNVGTRHSWGDVRRERVRRSRR